MKIVLYKKLEGKLKELEDKYHYSRLITTRYTNEQLCDWKNVDLYFIMGIDSLKEQRILDDAMLTEQYKKLIIRYHPDTTKCSREVFLIIQKAYNTLRDPIKRHKYDSFILDETIPEDKEYEEDEFYDVFAQAFQKNAKFSKIEPTAIFGDKKTEYKDVESFYKFWQSYESTRNYEYFDEEDYEGMNRDDRKYREKKCKATREKIKRDDMLRIRNLVTLAIKKDPRLMQLRFNAIDKKMKDMKITVNPKLINGKWTEDEILNLYNAINKCKKQGKVDWTNVVKCCGDIKKNDKEIMIKGNEILRMGIKK
ncbi:DnaJ (Hsp40) [Binucleata daphniae]